MGIGKRILLTLFGMIVAFAVAVIANYFMGNMVPWSDYGFSVSEYVNNSARDIPDTITLNFSDKTSSKLNIADNLSTVIEPYQYSFQDYITAAKPIFNVTYIVDKSKLKKDLSTIYQEGKEAQVSISDGKVVLYKADAPKDFDIDSVADEIANQYADKQFDKEIDMSKFPSKHIVDSNESMEKVYDKAKWLNDWHVSYDKSVTITGSDLMQYLNKSYDLEVDKIEFNGFLGSLEKVYNDGNKVIKFKKHNGKETDVHYNTYGKHVYRDKETAFLKQALKDQKSYTGRTPETYGYGDEIKGTYIEVSIADQHLWYYKNGKVKSQTDVVTGDVTKSRGTPTGVFYVSEKIPGKDLKGNNYTTWVNRWMRLTNQGVGLHDAYWRGSFGGSIYKGSGSHGCINLPKQFAYDLYDMVSVGIPVVIY